MIRKAYSLICVLITAFAFPQEGLMPLTWNLNYVYKDLRTVESVKPGGHSQKRSAAAPISLPFIDDFYYSTTNNYPNQGKWSDSMVYINSGFPIAPPSIGVATFDGLNKYGYPYDPTSPANAISKPADTLTSRPIALGSSTLDPATSNVALSFYYQAKGNGDTPETSDSLLVDFYKPGTNTWSTVWHTRGISNTNYNDTTFKYAFIRIDSAAYFNDGFRFRFRNWAATSGNFDHWHVDYIMLDHHRVDSVDTTRYDVSITHLPTSFLRDYSAMPFQQYNANEMAKRLSVRIRNNYEEDVNSEYRYRIYDKDGNQLYRYVDTGFAKIPPFKPNGYWNNQPFSNPDISDTFLLPPSDSVDFIIKHSISPFISSSIKTDKLQENDTVIQFQRFRNYYALDDGSAEAGYFVTGVKAKMAVKIRLNVLDTLRALRIYFDPAGSVNLIGSPTSIYKFRIYVWGDNNGVPGPIVHGDSSWLIPKYINGEHSPFIEYPISPRKILSPGTYYIGFQQQSLTGTVTVGFDKNYNRKTALFYDSGSGWAQSSRNGAIMIHPVFGKYIPPPVGLNENALSENNLFLVYPNPSSGQFTIRSQKPEGSAYQLVNSVGQVIREETIRDAEHIVSTGAISPGIYFLILKVNGRPAQQQKIIIQH